MTTVTDERSEMDAYIDAVKAHLGDLPGDEREDVLDDLRAHLAEVSAESDEPLAELLGPPEAYAAELRTSAGYGPATRTGRRPLRSLAEHPSVAAVTRFLPEVKPGWWVLRAAVLVVTAAVWNGATHADFPIPSLLGSALVTIVAIAALIPVSVAVGRRSRWGSILMSVAAVIGGLVALTEVGGSLPSREIVYTRVVPASPEMRAADGRPIFNIYPFAADGTPLENVLLYDQDGVPLDNLAPFTRGGIPVDRRHRVDAGGRPITNSYPQEVFLPGLGAAPRQDQRPPVTVPEPPPPPPSP